MNKSNAPWSIINTNMGGNFKDASFNEILLNGTKLNDFHSIADAFNKHFANLNNMCSAFNAVTIKSSVVNLNIQKIKFKFINGT